MARSMSRAKCKNCIQLANAEVLTGYLPSPRKRKDLMIALILRMLNGEAD
ncbi:hypothetical protein GCM10023171_26090 [Microbacterium panaciterrae]|uniref:Uncharacterized protein n=1 Tax=Microbacterium panaciterrae TaxID=985759 RepID=A0ABP8PL55_9MICO